MKKLLCLVFVITFVLLYSSVCFAATVPNPDAPGAAPSVTEDMYPDDVPQSADINDQNVPASGELVKTGGIPVEMFYAVGALCIIAAFIISRKTNKVSTSKK